ncbi:MAG: dTDP-4-dehydrorhamnose 3,5-epimerase [Planctomycetes bacterium]|nr:dTDP-4-dehydrorhamnose 3,5-epimerase [Planctomycetota bacterium]
MNVVETELPGVLVIEPKVFPDARGFFMETYHQERYREAGIDLPFVQDSLSFSRKDAVRGLHFQNPFAQGKLAYVLQGEVFDVAVDIRRGSPTFRHWVGLELSAEQWNQLLVPRGFAHGFVTLEPETEVQYKVTAPYSAVHERSLRFDDSNLGIEWPVARDELILSDKDRSAPSLTEIETSF